MGSALAANLVGAGNDVVAYDAAGPDRGPDSVVHVAAVADVAQRADVVVCSLPDGDASESRRPGDRSRPPIAPPRMWSTRRRWASPPPGDLDALLGEHGVAYVDAPVSGGVAGARAARSR